MSATKTEVHEAIKAVFGGKDHKTMSGNCARFAAALHQALGGQGEFMIVDGDHPEYVDHVLLRYDGALFDGTGRVTVDSVRKEWGARPTESGCDEDEILRLVDDSDCYGPQLDVDETAEALAEHLPKTAPAP